MKGNTIYFTTERAYLAFVRQLMKAGAEFEGGPCGPDKWSVTTSRRALKGAGPGRAKASGRMPNPLKGLERASGAATGLVGRMLMKTLASLFGQLWAIVWAATVLVFGLIAQMARASICCFVLWPFLILLAARRGALSGIPKPRPAGE